MNKDMIERAKALADMAIRTRHPESAYIRDFLYSDMLIIQEALQSLSTPPEPSEGMGDAINKAYTSRMLAVCMLAKKGGYSYGIGKDDNESWDDEWRNVVYIDLPEGQVSWHIAPHDMHIFEGFPEYKGQWDGKFNAHCKDFVKALTAPAVPQPGMDLTDAPDDLIKFVDELPDDLKTAIADGLSPDPRDKALVMMAEALSECMTVVSDRAAGGKMLTNSQTAERILKGAGEALTAPAVPHTQTRINELYTQSRIEQPVQVDVDAALKSFYNLAGDIGYREQTFLQNFTRYLVQQGLIAQTPDPRDKALVMMGEALEIAKELRLYNGQFVSAVFPEIDKALSDPAVTSALALAKGE